MLEVRDISKAFGGITAVSEVSFAVSSGEVVSLIGPNGAGKTTCFNLITGFYKLTSGRVEFDGRDVTAWPPPAMARLGVIRTFQKTNILKDLSVFENVLTAHHRRGLRAAEINGRN